MANNEIGRKPAGRRGQGGNQSKSNPSTRRFIAFLAGAIAGFAFVQWLASPGAQPLLAKVGEMATARVRASVQKSIEQQQVHQQQGFERARRERMGDRQGQKLGRECADWRQADKQLSTDTTQTEARKACDRYEAYLRTGR